MDFGDEVEILLKEGEKIRGILMPRPKILTNDIIVIKLDSGYNIGVYKRKIKRIKVLKRYKKKKKRRIKIKRDKNLEDVSIISTGGTISSIVDYRTGGVYARYTAEDFISFEPKLKKFANLYSVPLINKMSEDINYRDWIKIARATHKELKKGRGVVITHGTDTMHFTSAALSFMLRTPKPVVLTGAQRSSDRPSSDAYMNLLCSTILATKDIPTVGICMHGTMSDDYCEFHLGTRVRKMHSSRRDAFKSIGIKPIAKVWPEGILKVNWKPKGDGLKLNTKLNPNVALIYAYPGYEKLLENLDVDGLVIAGTGMGHVETKSIKILKKMGIPICITTQTLHGRVHPYVYSNLRKLSSIGAIFCEDMLPEVAYVKLMYVLGNGLDITEMKKNFVGEITKRSIV